MKFKKILSGAIAAATLAASVGLFPVSAAYDVCDVNKDGVVNVRDVSIIANYCAGNLKVPDYNRLDVNKSLIVDNMDEQCVLAKVMGWSYDCDYFSRKTQKYLNAPTVSSIILNEAANQTVSRVYWKYSYKNKKQTPYILRPTTTTISIGSSTTYALMGEDDRYLASGSENCGIVRLSNGGTGFIVGDHHIATNAHNVYHKETGTWKELTHINTYNKNGILLNTRLTPVEAHFPEIFINNGMYDYALITVKEDLSNYIHFDLGTSYSVNATNFANVPIYVTGCSQADTDGNLNENNRLYSAEGKILSKLYTGTTSLSNRAVLHYDMDTTPGNSGSPVYTITRNIIDNKTSYTYTAIGIHYGGMEDSYNCAALVTKYLLQFYKNNSRASWTE